MSDEVLERPAPTKLAIEVYWATGCSSCLRMKEFIESTGVDYVAIDTATDPTGQEKLKRIGGRVPCTVVGDAFADGVDLAAVARLIQVPYDPPTILPIPELRARYRTVIETLCRLTAQADGKALDYERPERKRTLRDIAYHAASVMRLFLNAYDPELYDERYDQAQRTPEDVRDAAAVIDRAQATLAAFERWWARDGHDDPLERVERVYWGHRTLLEILEREVWHTAQHTRQVAMFLSETGITPDRPLGPAELAGLPMPSRVFD